MAAAAAAASPKLMQLYWKCRWSIRSRAGCSRATARPNKRAWSPALILLLLLLLRVVLLLLWGRCEKV